MATSTRTGTRKVARSSSSSSSGTSSTQSKTQKLTNPQWNHLMKTLQTMKPAAARGATKRASAGSKTQSRQQE